MNVRRNTDVLIVGGGGAGLTASMLLSGYGVDSYLVSRYARTSNLPKASGLSIKTMEIFRELGLQDDICALATPPEYNSHTGYFAGLAGHGPDYNRPIVRFPYWDGGGTDHDWCGAGTVRARNLPQSQLEPLMRARAEAMAPGGVRYHHEFVEFEQHADHVTATIEDRDTGERYQVDAKYLLACDGGRNVGKQLGVVMDGHLAVATSVSVHFSADLSPWYRDRTTMLSFIMNPDVGIPCGLVANGPNAWGGRSTEWVAHLLSFSGDHKALDDEAAVALMRRCLGIPDVPVEVHVINRWPLDAVVASSFRVGRVFLLGDAAHRMPPAGGHGLNTAVADAYNLAWKLKLVLDGDAGEEILESYESERRPVAQHNVATAFAGWQANKDMVMAIGIRPDQTPEENWANVRLAWTEGPAGDERRQRIASVLPKVLPNSNPLNGAHGYTYHDGLVITDEPAVRAPLEPRGVFTASTEPGHSVPDCYLENFFARAAIGDLVARGRFVLIAGEDGRAWVEAARIVARDRGIRLDAFTIGDGGDWFDTRDRWSRVATYGPRGAIVVRPDRFIAWRSTDAVENAPAELDRVFDTLLRVRSAQPA